MSQKLLTLRSQRLWGMHKSKEQMNSSLIYCQHRRTFLNHCFEVCNCKREDNKILYLKILQSQGGIKYAYDFRLLRFTQQNINNSQSVAFGDYLRGLRRLLARPPAVRSLRSPTTPRCSLRSPTHPPRSSLRSTPP